MPEGVVKPRFHVWGQVKVERGGKLLYQSPPEEVKVTSLLHHLYEKRRVRYCWLTAGEDIPLYYRTGELPLRFIGVELIIMETKISYRRLKKWLKGLRRPTSSM